MADGDYTISVTAPAGSDYNDGTGTFTIKDGQVEAVEIILTKKPTT